MGTVGIVPVMATSGAEIGDFGNIGGGHAGSGCDRIDRGGSCQHKGCRNGGGSEPSLHVNAPLVQHDADQRITRAPGSSDISTQDRPANCGPASNAPARGDITSGASGASGDDGAGDASGASALQWSPVWNHPEPRWRRRDCSATMPGRARREPPARAIRRPRRSSGVSSRSWQTFLGSSSHACIERLIRSAAATRRNGKIRVSYVNEN